MARKSVFCLTFMLFVSSLAMVYVRHQHRLEYSRLTTANAERDDLAIEWNTLMTAVGTWSSQERVENEAKNLLNMRSPLATEIISVE